MIGMYIFPDEKASPSVSIINFDVKDVPAIVEENRQSKYYKMAHK